jgi:hypothetical protein
MSGQVCAKCGEPLSMEVGIVQCTTLADDAPITLFCQPCAPNQGKGYTIADLAAMREESQAGARRNT